MFPPFFLLLKPTKTNQQSTKNIHPKKKGIFHLPCFFLEQATPTKTHTSNSKVSNIIIFTNSMNKKNPSHTFFLRFTISCHPGGFPTFSSGYGAFRVGRMLRRSFTQVLRNLGPAAASVAFMNQEFRGEDVLLDGGRISPRSWPYPHQNYHHQKLRLQWPALLRDKQVATNPHVVFIQNYVVVSNIFYFHPYLGRWSNLTSIFFKWVGSTTN